MGCDIHLVLEKKHEGKWVAIDTFKSHHRLRPTKDDIMDGWSSPVARSRNYARFAKLAGVRGDGPEPLGIPNDASETTKYLVADRGSDGHSHSWLPMMAAATIFLATQPIDGLSDGVTKFPEDYFFNASPLDVDDAKNYRVVFWFDN